MSLRTAAVVLSAGMIAGCVYPTPPPPIYSYVPCPPGPVSPPAAPPGGVGGNQCLAATVPYPPFRYYIVPGYSPYGGPYYPGAGVSFGFGGVIR